MLAWVWLADGELHERVFDVASSAAHPHPVDVETCEASLECVEMLCAVWRDPYLDASERAFYYMRVLEQPCCRWRSWRCGCT